MRLFGLIGYPLTHSFSKKYFTEKFSKEKIEAAYELFPLKAITEIKDLLESQPQLSGLNVTIPHKETIIPYLYELDATAKSVGAVNCIKIENIFNSGLKTQNLRLKGYNTDVFGFKQSIKPFLESHHEKALILGTGGGSKAVEYVLKEIGIECFFVSREKSDKPNYLTYEEVNEHVINACKLIVNATPLGMYPNGNTFPNIPYEHLSSGHFLYDLVYNPEETEFLKQGKAQDSKTMNGLSMLHLQAEKAWEIWNMKTDVK